MPSLPQHGDLNWGAVLNEFLSVAHRPDGYLRNVPRVTNVLDYGVTTEQTDGALMTNTAAFQLALDEAEGRVLYIPWGTYRVGELSLPSNLVIIGDGNSSVLTFTALKATDDPKRGCLFTNKDWASGNSNIHIRQLRLIGNRDMSTNLNTARGNANRGHGVNFRFASRCTIERVSIEDFVFDGIYLGTSDPDQGDGTNGSNENIVQFSNIIGNGRNGISITRGSDNRIVHNLLTHNNKGVTDRDDPAPYPAGAIDIEPFGDFEDVSRNLISGNRLLDNHYNGIQILTNPLSTGITVTDNVVHGSGRHGLAVAGTHNLTITGNTISLSAEAGMALGLGSGVVDTIVSSNQVYSNGSHGIVVNGESTVRVIIANNISVRNGMQQQDHRGITVADGRDVVVTGNISTDNSGTEQIGLPVENGVFSSNIGRPHGIASFQPQFARTGETRATTTATTDIVFQRGNDQTWQLMEREDGLYLRNLATGEQPSRIALERDLRN